MHSTVSVEQQMKTEHTRKAAVDLYWLAFLLTGSRDISIDIAADAAVSEDDANPFFTDWIHGWQRRLVIAKALTAIHGELADSARRTEIAQASRSGTPRNWSLSPYTTKADLERALLAIDPFPRATLLLLAFEGVRIADAATLLDADPDLLKKTQAIGLRELRANLAATNTDAVSAPPELKPLQVTIRRLQSVLIFLIQAGQLWPVR
jgi:DNA-directed RNA polymerase specialized sigma24 family protein